MPAAARKGDTDNFGHTIDGQVSTNVRINGIAAAMKGSTMDDGVAITGGVVASVRVNGQPIAVVGSTTDPHSQDPGKDQSGTINQGSPDVKAG